MPASSSCGLLCDHAQHLVKAAAFYTWLWDIVNGDVMLLIVDDRKDGWPYGMLQLLEEHLVPCALTAGELLNMTFNRPRVSISCLRVSSSESNVCYPC